MFLSTIANYYHPIAHNWSGGGKEWENEHQFKDIKTRPRRIKPFFQGLGFLVFFFSFLRKGGNNSKCSLGITKISQKWGKLIAVLCVLNEVRIASFRQTKYFSFAFILHLTIREKKENTKTELHSGGKVTVETSTLTQVTCHSTFLKGLFQQRTMCFVKWSAFSK